MANSFSSNPTLADPLDLVTGRPLTSAAVGALGEVNNWLIQMAAPQMRERKDGAVIIIGMGHSPIEAYLAAAVVYFILCYALSWLVKRLHKKIAIIR